ncbi:putative U1 snRNP-associated protein Usp106 [Cardiosporidium cionae]|uniref:U1 snRNP-associated protein Usp106 n=1 Tax=Cardiosporidium cionae TaxID=476202 RepID=A0ABQ7JF01_9APIC|nr:putative U1 snRNP-associated protein Usp106 [Cardiosporidium cionae]|eukprot:KAF8822529.1 putative U1 snRNP-associated protein Usp106 [Cardiosporidium cionae]
MDEMRAQLSLLMDTINEENRPREKQFTDSSFCRMYLAGICPHDLFANTKHYLGACPKEHSDEMRMRFLEARKKKRYGFEEETLHVIQPLVDDSDRKIFRGQARCEDVDKKGVVDERSDEVRKLDQQIEAIMKQAEELGNEGKIDESMKMMVKVEQLNEEKAKHLEEEKNGDFAFNQKLKPCDVCGALLAATDSDRRLSEHFSGKIHIGFQMLRDAVKDLNAYLQTPLPDESHSKSKDGERDSGRSDRGDRRVDPANTASRSDEKYASSYHGNRYTFLFFLHLKLEKTVLMLTLKIDFSWSSSDLMCGHFLEAGDAITPS